MAIDYGSNNVTTTGSLTAASGSITSLSTVPTFLSPSAIGSSQNNYNPGAGDVLRLSASTSGINITGIVLGTEYTRVIINIGATYNITLNNESASSSAANRIITSTGGDHIIPPSGTVTLLYDTTSSRWRVL